MNSNFSGLWPTLCAATFPRAKPTGAGQSVSDPRSLRLSNVAREQRGRPLHFDPISTNRRREPLAFFSWPLAHGRHLHADKAQMTQSDSQHIFSFRWFFFS
jgi:hypothetical protein